VSFVIRQSTIDASKAASIHDFATISPRGCDRRSSPDAACGPLGIKATLQVAHVSINDAADGAGYAELEAAYLSLYPHGKLYRRSQIRGRKPAARFPRDIDPRAEHAIGLPDSARIDSEPCPQPHHLNSASTCAGERSGARGRRPGPCSLQSTCSALAF
jgi:hypothetical protein